ncbi:MAG: phosphate acyltransferase PlsX [Acidobacteriota bacterium]
MKIAIDAMGSEMAPETEILGAIQAIRELGVGVCLVGPEPLLREHLRKHRVEGLPIDVVHASETIAMDEPVSSAVRKKKDSSIRVAVRLVREGQAHGVVSAGNTGACMAIAKLVLGSLSTVDRPALAAIMPTAQGKPVLLLDVGANVDCKPQNLLQFAIMGEILSRYILGASRPKVGLLSIGEEEIKGNELTREVIPLLKTAPLNFVGNVEGRDVFRGDVDVIVCDGFVGNVSLKLSEGLVDMFSQLLKRDLSSSLASRIGALLSRRAFLNFRSRVDYDEYGGATLLGVKGVAIICHGRSTAKAVKNAVRMAHEFCTRRVNERIEEEIHSLTVFPQTAEGNLLLH